MSVRRIGFSRVQRMLEDLPEATRRQLGEAQEDNAGEIVRVARVLVRVGKTGRSKAAIHTEKSGDGQIIDFGPLSKILEGGTGERQQKTGKGTGQMPEFPFVNPSLMATRKERTKRLRKALRDAVKDARGNG